MPVFEEGEDGAGSFNLIRNGTFLARVSETEFEVVAKTTSRSGFCGAKTRTVGKHHGAQARARTAHDLRRGKGLSRAAGTASMDETCAADGSVPDPETEHLMQLAKDALGIEIEIE